MVIFCFLEHVYNVRDRPTSITYIEDEFALCYVLIFRV